MCFFGYTELFYSWDLENDPSLCSEKMQYLGNCVEMGVISTILELIRLLPDDMSSSMIG